MHVQWTNPMSSVQRTNPICYTDQSYGDMVQVTILWRHDACIEDNTYGTVHVATRTNVQSQVRTLCHA